MQLYEVKKYLQQQHLDFDNNIDEDLKKIKQKAVLESDEKLANEIWCLEETYKIQKTYISMYNQLKAGKYFEGWLLLEQIDISFCSLSSLRAGKAKAFNANGKISQNAYSRIVFSCNVCRLHFL